MDDRFMAKEKTTAAFQRRFKRKGKFNIFTIIKDKTLAGLRFQESGMSHFS